MFIMYQQDARNQFDGVLLIVMKAMQLIDPRYFALTHISIPELQRDSMGKILVRLERASICGSDIPEFSGALHDLSYPLAPGAPVHECVGEVVESTSDSICPGEYVVAIPEGDQGLAEFFIAQSAKSFCLPDQLRRSFLSLLVQPLATVLYGADKLGDVSGSIVAIIGLGPIGQLMCWLFKKRGANILFGVDPCLERCLAAERMGITQSFAMSSLELLHQVRSNSIFWEAPHICIEAVGHQTSTINDCIGLVRPSGTILAMGVPDRAIYPLEYQLLFRQNLHLIASVTPDWRIYLPDASNLLCSYLEDLEFLVTHQFPIQEVQEAYHLYEQQGASLKILLDASEW